MVIDLKRVTTISKRYLIYAVTLLGVILFAVAGASALGQSPFFILTILFLLIGTPLIVYAVIFNHRLAMIVLMVAFPFHSLMMRVIEVDLGITGGAATLISMWKELVILALLGRLIFVSPKYFSSIDALIILYAVFNLFYAVVPGEYAAGFYGFRGVIEPFIIYFLIRIIGRERVDINNLFRLLIRVGAVLGIFAVIQLLFLDANFVMTYKAIEGQLSNSHTTRVAGNFIFRSSATFTSPNHLGMYLAILGLVAIGVYLESQLALRKVLLPLALIGLGVLTSFSRSSWLALLTGLLFFLFVKLVTRKVKGEILIGLFFLSIFAVPAIYFFGVANYIVSTLSLNELSAAGKIPSIINGIQFIFSNPLGIGLGLAGPRSTRFGELTIHSENFYVITGMEVGIIGLILYLVIVLSLIMRLYHIYKRLENRFEKGITLGTLAAFIGAHTGILFIPSLQELSVATLLWLWVGISLHFYYLHLQDKKIKNQPVLPKEAKMEPIPQ